jgi:hypothetical protein
MLEENWQMNNFNWSQYEADQEEKPVTSKPSFEWEKFENLEKEPEQEINEEKLVEKPSKLKEFGRHAARIGSRIGETIVGFPGDIVQFTKGISQHLPKTGEEPTEIQKLGRGLLEKLPTNEDVKKVTSYLTSGFTDPKSATEELGDELTSLSTSLAIPFKNPGSFTKFLGSLGKSIAQSTAAVGARKGVEEFGGSKTAQNSTELGVLFLTSLIGKKTANKYVSEQYQQAKSKIPAGTMLPTESLLSDLNSIEKDLSVGIGTPTKNEVLGAIQELKNKAAGGAMPAEDLVQSFHDINERMTGKRLFEDLNKTERKLLKSRYDKFKDKVTNSIADYGKYNPDFYTPWKRANQGFATLAESRKVSAFLEQNIKKLPPHIVTSVAFDLFLGKPAATGITAATYLGVKTGELLYRVAKSPTLSKHYLDVVTAAGKENLPGVINALNRLDKELNNPQDRH